MVEEETEWDAHKQTRAHKRRAQKKLNGEKYHKNCRPHLEEEAQIVAIDNS
jgi:hypothetical protein